MKPVALLIVACCFCFCLAAPALADIVYLKDGTKLEGEVKRTRDGYLVTDPAGRATAVADADVKSFEVKKAGGGNPGTASAEERLASLRRATANLADPKQAVERYQSFIAEVPNTPTAKEAAQEMAAWQDRLDKGLVRAGNEWVTKDQAAQLQAKATTAAEQIRPTIVAGRMADAGAALDRMLAVSPQNPALLYLKGVVMFRQSQLVPARKAFEGVAAQLPENGAVHNNLGVILWRTHAQMQAMAEYDKAMIAATENQTILDNVAEALHALPESYHKSELTKRVVQHFKDQDAGLQKRMAQRGLYRWGSQWLNEKEFAVVQAAERAVKEKIAEYQKEFDDNQARLIRIDREIQDDQNLMNTMMQDSAVMDPTSGRIVQLPPPPRFYDLQRDIKNLQAERAMKQHQQLELQRLAQEQQKTVPAPRYTGIQKPFDVEAMPGGTSSSSAVPAAATAPAASAIAAPPPPTAQPVTAGAPTTTQPSGASFGNSTPDRPRYPAPARQ